MPDRLAGECLKQLMAREDLSVEQTEQLFERIMGGQVETALLSGLLVAWAIKGESVEELVGAARVMRRLATPVRCPGEPIDTCGTGGDETSTLNVSTAAAIIAAASGAIVAKHGNRTNTRRSGSAEALAALGVDIEAPIEVVERCLEEIGLGFLYAVKLHPAMKHAAPARRALGIRTIFNLLGPLTNPAGARRQVLGVNRPDLQGKIAEALRLLGAQHALVVHGDGLCDMTITGRSRVIEVRPEKISEWQIEPQDVGLKRARLEELLIDSPAASAAAIEQVLAGEPGPKRDIAVLNAAAALLVAGIAADFGDGVRKAQEAIDSGAARDKLERLRRITHAER